MHNAWSAVSWHQKQIMIRLERHDDNYEHVGSLIAALSRVEISLVATNPANMPKLG
jgi:hypothetical protein